MCNGKMFLIVGLVVLLLPAVSVVRGHYPGYVVDAVYSAPPVVDGAITSEEWSAASTVQFNNTVVYVMQDGNCLFVGFNVSDSTVNPNDDSVGFFIDINHDGALQTDDILFTVYRNGTAGEAHGMAPLTPPAGWGAAVQSQAKGWMAEFNITYAKIGVNAGEKKTLGVLLVSGDQARGEPYLWPPVGTWGVFNPAVWADLKSQANWIPEFPNLLLLIAVPSTATIIAIKKKLKC